MSIVTTISTFFTRRPYLLYGLVFVIALSLFGYLQFDPTLADPDSFYHAKMAELLRDRGLITDFPWLSATTLKYNYIDHHLLYHLLLIPFVTWLPPLIGIKVATVLLAALATLVFFWFLRQLNVRGAFWYTLFLLTVEPFIFRVSLAKAQALVLILLFISLYCLLRRYYLAFLLTVFFYVWLYAGWPLLAGLTLLYLLISLLYQRQSKDWLILQRTKWRMSRHSLKLLLVLVLGVGAGLILSPYFAKNLYFYWQQSFKIAIINYQGVIGVGSEWYSFTLPELVSAAAPFLLLLLVGLVLFAATYRRQPLHAWLFLVVSLLFFGLTIKSRRNIEYFVPLAICFSAIAITTASTTISKRLKKINAQQPVAIILVLFCLALTPIFYRHIQWAKYSLQQGLSLTRFATAAEWLETNTPRGSIVFHSDWDEFPLLFYHNDWNYYLVGLDPTFMYEYDKDLHRRWVDITTGKTNADLAQTIGTLFGAQYVLVDIVSNLAFDRNIAADSNFQLVFSDNEVRIYRVTTAL